MNDNREFSFENLMSAANNNEPEYAEWFKARAVRFASVAADRIRHVSAFRTTASQSEAWGDHFNPEYELRRAAATLIGLEEKLEESMEALQDNMHFSNLLEEALVEVRECMHGVKEDFSKANSWFVAVDSLFSGRLLE